MKSLGIESKFIANDERHVTQYRRLVTPWFYIALKPRKYEYIKNEQVFSFIFVFRVNGWFFGDQYLEKGVDKKTDKLLLEINKAVSDLKPTNVVRFKQ